MDAIEAARAKAAKKWSKLDQQTVPLYDKMFDGKATDSDMERLRQLYKMQSKTATQAFDETVAAAKESAKASVKATVKEVVKKHQLLTAKELANLLAETVAITLQKSAPIIKQAVEDALEDHIDTIDQATKDIRRIQVKSDEIIKRLRTMTESSSMVSRILKRQDDSQTGLFAKIFKRDKTQEEKLKETLLAMSDVISAKVTSVIMALDKAKGKSKSLFKRVFSRGSSNDVFSDQFAKDQQSFFSKAVSAMSGRSDDRYSRFDSSSDSVMSRAVRAFLDPALDVESLHKVESAQDIRDLDQLVDAVKGYKELYDKFEDEERDLALAQESNFSDKVFEFLAPKIDEQIVWLAEHNFARQLEENRVAYGDELTEKLDQLREGIDEDGNFSYKAYSRYRALILRDLKKTWTRSAKEKADILFKKVKRQRRKIGKFAKLLGAAYLTALAINAVSAIMPEWKSMIMTTIGKAGKFVMESGEAIGKGIATIAIEAISWVANNPDKIAIFAYKIAEGLISTFVKAACNLLGIDYDKVFGGKSKLREGLEASEDYTANSTDFLDDPKVKSWLEANKMSASEASHLLSVQEGTDETDNFDEAQEKRWAAIKSYFNSWQVENRRKSNAAKDERKKEKEQEKAEKEKEKKEQESLIDSITNFDAIKGAKDTASFIAQYGSKNISKSYLDLVSTTTHSASNGLSIAQQAIDEQVKRAKSGEYQKRAQYNLNVARQSLGQKTLVAQQHYQNTKAATVNALSASSKYVTDKAATLKTELGNSMSTVKGVISDRYASADINQAAPFIANTSAAIEAGLDKVTAIGNTVKEKSINFVANANAVDRPTAPSTQLASASSASNPISVSQPSVQLNVDSIPNQDNSVLSIYNAGIMGND